MPTGAIANEDFLPLIRQGDALISRIVVSGWQTLATTLRTTSDKNRFWGKISPTSGDGYFQLFKRPAMAAGDLVAHGVIASNAVTLAAANSSGITGSADIPSFTAGQTHLFDFIVSYGDELDLTSVYAGVANELDANSKWEAQGTRFETLLLETKRLLDSLLWSRLRELVGTDVWGRPRLSYISDPRQYARVHALFTAAAIYQARTGVARSGVDAARKEMADNLFAQAEREFALIQPILDVNRDMRADDQPNIRSLRARRA